MRAAFTVQPIAWQVLWLLGRTCLEMKGVVK